MSPKSPHDFKDFPARLSPDSPHRHFKLSRASRKTIAMRWSSLAAIGVKTLALGFRGNQFAWAQDTGFKHIDYCRGVHLFGQQPPRQSRQVNIAFNKKRRFCRAPEDIGMLSFVSACCRGRYGEDHRHGRTIERRLRRRSKTGSAADHAEVGGSLATQCEIPTVLTCR